MRKGPKRCVLAEGFLRMRDNRTSELMEAARRAKDARADMSWRARVRMRAPLDDDATAQTRCILIYEGCTATRKAHAPSSPSTDESAGVSSIS